LVPFALCVMATYLTRPAYLSLVVQLPLLGLAIVQSRRVHRPTFRELTRTAAVLAAATLIPLIAYCTLRSVVVGRFGVVASGGFNVIGVAGQFLDDEMVGSLPDDLQPLARHALTHRPPEDGDQSVLMTDAPVLNYQRIENRYDRTIWRIFYPAAEQTESSAVTSVNTRLRRLAQEIVRQRPKMYAVYLIKAFRRAVFKIVGDTVLNPYCLSLCLLIAGVTLIRILRPSAVRTVDPESGAEFDLLSLMVLATLSFAACQMAVVILVCPPLGRMTDAMALFVPALLMAFLIDRAAALLRR